MTRRPGRRRGLLALCAFAALAANPLQHPLAQDRGAGVLPDGEARPWVLEQCTRCHDLSPILAAGYSKEGWEQNIVRMLGNAMPSDEIARAAGYLAKAFPELSVSVRRGSEPEYPGVTDFRPVSGRELRDPDPEDWLMYSRTYDAQRFSPLDQVDDKNVARLALAWSLELPDGLFGVIPLVRDGVIYTMAPGARVMALDGATGDALWVYRRPVSSGVAARARGKTIAIYQDLVLYAAPAGYLVALDARDGTVRWEKFVGSGEHVSGTFVADGTVFTGRACRRGADCFIAAHDAMTGEERWRFHTVPSPDDRAADTWGDAVIENMVASTWGLPGSYDPVRRMLYWGVANPDPYTRLERNPGGVSATSETAPAALYSNSTLALDPDTGALKWYYQHLPGDGWDQDYPHERTLLRSVFDPDPATVDWINPAVERGLERDMAVMVGEGGGVFVLDREDGGFLWAAQFPYKSEHFVLSDIDERTGVTHINVDLLHHAMGERKLICPYNTRSYWPTAYSPLTNALYVSYVDSCLDMTAGGARFGTPRPGIDLDRFAGIARIDMRTGAISRFGERRAPDNGAVLVTAGNLVFHGDLNRRFRAYDASTGEQLWQTILGGPVRVSTITYAIDGRQYVLVTTGGGHLSSTLGAQVDLPVPMNRNAIYVFRLPEN